MRNAVQFGPANGLRLAWRRWGDAYLPPLVCLHGAYGCSDLWAPFAEAIACRFHVIAPDLRGHGPQLRQDLAARLRETPAGLWRWRTDARVWTTAQRRRWFECGDLWSGFARIACPLQLVRGGCSTLVDGGALDRMISLQPAAQVATIPGAGHSVPRDAPQAFLAAVRSYLTAAG